MKKLTALLFACSLLTFGQATQPNLAQYPVSDLYTTANYATLSAALAAGVPVTPAGGNGICLFNPALPVKGWVGSGYVSVFQAGLAVSIVVPSTSACINLPGQVPLSPYVIAPTAATLTVPYGTPTPIQPQSLSTKADADAFVALVGPLFPGVSVSDVDGSSTGVFQTIYPLGESRKQWILKVGNYAYGYAAYIGQYIAQKNQQGVDAPGSYQVVSLEGEPATLNWVALPQVLTAPAGAVTMPPPIRALLANEQFQLVNPEPQNPLSQASWMVVRTDLQQTNAQQIAAIEAQIAALQAQLAALQQ